ncbi:hypothetical protein JHK85_004914 [Glycine max]|nr:hypothetical protein JHK85_004914 [Glycine max]
MLWEFKGYVFIITGGCDKQGFPIKQGVLTPGRVCLLLHRGTPCFRGYGRRNGERRRKSVRGCIVSPDLSVLKLDVEKPRMRGPKRASKIRKLFNLSKDDVRKYVNTYRRTFTTKNGEKGVSPNTGKSLHYKGSFFHQIIKGSIVQSTGDSRANVKRLEQETEEKIHHLKTEVARILDDVVAMLLKYVTSVKN